jgi:hypothetical protein
MIYDHDAGIASRICDRVHISAQSLRLSAESCREPEIELPADDMDSNGLRVEWPLLAFALAV